jgi:hypothetical protein
MLTYGAGEHRLGRCELDVGDIRYTEIRSKQNDLRRYSVDYHVPPIK